MKRILLSMLVLAGSVGLASAQNVLSQGRLRQMERQARVERAGAEGRSSVGEVAMLENREGATGQPILMARNNARIAARESAVVNRGQGRLGRAVRRQMNDRQIIR